MEVDRKFLTNDQQLVLREWEALEKTPAWEWVVEEAKANREVLQNALMYSIQDERGLYWARGQIAVYDYIISRLASAEQEFNALIESAELTRSEIEDSAGANS